MIESEILKALQTAVIAASAAATPNNIPIKALGISFTPPDDQKFLEIVVITNNETNEYWGDEKTYRGFLRLILHWPIDGAGIYSATDYLASVCAYFTKGLKLSLTGMSEELTITDSPNFMGQIDAPPELLFPASIPYQVFKA